MGKTILILILVIAPQVIIAGNLIEIDRIGHTKSIQMHYIKNEPTNREKPRKLTPEEYYKSLLPIKTIGMQPGVITNMKRKFPNIERPIFIIGSDELSMSWLKENKEILIEIDALGMLVEVSNIDDLKKIGTLGNGLTISPMNGVQVSEFLGIDKYPILITRDGYEQ